MSLYCHLSTLHSTITQRPITEKISREFRLAKGPPKVDLAQEALQILSVKDQEKLQSEGTQYLLTPEALRKHDILTGVLELRQFACKKCDHVWWRTVSRTKAVAKCNHCRVKYDALPRDKEFGIGRYRCTNCNHSFFSRCKATTERPCFNCDNTVRTPYIHPKFKPAHRSRQHDIVSVVISDPESDEEEISVHESLTGFESDSGVSSISHEASSDQSASDVDSTAGTIDSDSDSDEIKQPRQHTQVPVDDLQPVSSDISSAKDSGLGIAEVASLTAEKRYTSSQGILHRV